MRQITQSEKREVAEMLGWTIPISSDSGVNFEDVQWLGLLWQAFEDALFALSKPGFIEAGLHSVLNPATGEKEYWCQGWYSERKATANAAIIEALRMVKEDSCAH